MPQCYCIRQPFNKGMWSVFKCLRFWCSHWKRIVFKTHRFQIYVFSFKRFRKGLFSQQSSVNAMPKRISFGAVWTGPKSPFYQYLGLKIRAFRMGVHILAPVEGFAPGRLWLLSSIKWHVSRAIIPTLNSLNENHMKLSKLLNLCVLVLGCFGTQYEVRTIKHVCYS